MEELLKEWGSWAYLIIIGWTFLEGETVVIIAGILASQGWLDVKFVWLSALSGGFAGDQMYYYIGRYYGTPLLERWPTMRSKIDWAFRLLRKYETVFILSFRFIYGVRNISPFVIGISGVPRMRYLVLNLIAAIIWASSFSFGGYYLGYAMENYLGEYKYHALGSFVGLAVVFGLYTWMRNRRQIGALVTEQEAQASEDAVAAAKEAEGR